MSLLADEIKLYFVISLHHHAQLYRINLSVFPTEFFCCPIFNSSTLIMDIWVLPKHCYSLPSPVKCTLQHSLKMPVEQTALCLFVRSKFLLPWSKGGAASVLQNYVFYLFATHKIDRSRAQVKECIYFLTQSFVIKNCHNSSPDTRTLWKLCFLSSTVNCGCENTCSRLLNSRVPPPLFHDHENISPNICVTIHIILKAKKQIILQTNAGKNRGLCRSHTCQEITILIINTYLTL